MCDRSEQIPQAIRSAFREMTTGRPGATHIGLPFDVMKGDVDPSDLWAQNGHERCPAWRYTADPKAIDAATEAILGAKRPVFA